MGEVRAQHVQGLFPLCVRNGSHLRVDVALVDGDEVGNLDDAFLDGLQIVTGIG